MGSAQPIVFVVDDDSAVRESLQWLLESVGLEAHTFASADAFLAAIGSEQPGCAIVDVRLPGISGLELQDRLKQSAIALPVIIITGHGDVPVAIRAMKAGACDFLEKPFSDQVLLERVRDALKLDAQRREAVRAAEALAARRERLTPRESQVMDLVVQGRLNKQIASELGLSPKTVEVHRSHVMDKMEAPTLAALVRMAVALEDAPVRTPA